MDTHRLPHLLALIGSAWLLIGQTHALAQQAIGTVDYQKQIHAALSEKCLGCHSEAKRSGGLSLATLEDALNGGRSGPAIRPGKSADSLLVQRLRAEGAARMPLGGPPLDDATVALFRNWIDEGARATPTSSPAKVRWEASLTLERPEMPGVSWPEWSAPVDRFTSRYLATDVATQLATAKPGSIADATFARRAYLDIWGLLPPPEELRRFQADATPGKRERLVSRLLADNRRYAENWVSFWNDLLRNDEGANYHSETASRKSITPWLLGALESNMPYRQFVRALLNPVEAGDPDGFLVGVNWRGTISASQTPAMQAAQNTAQVFLGVNLKCNSCHDSFIGKWKLRDAYRMAGFFSDEPKLQLYRCDVAQKEFAEAGFLFPAVARSPASTSLKDRRAAAAEIFTDPRNGRLSRTVVNRIWERLLGRGLVENSDDMDGEPWSPELLDWLAADFVEHGYDLKHLIATVVTSRTYQMPSVRRDSETAKAYVFRGPEVRRITAEQFADAVGAITGEWHVYQPAGAKLAAYTREWRVAGNSLTRALGRPIRDQVYSSRDTQATTLQALELVNGETLTHWLSRGARKMVGEAAPEPVSLFDKPLSGKNPPVAFDIDVAGAKKLWVLVQDRGSYSPEKLEAVWASPQLASLTPMSEADLRAPTENGAVRVKTPSRLVYDIAGKGLGRIQGTVGIENREITSELNPQLRFLVFTGEPDMERLTPVGPDAPLPPPAVSKAPAEAVDRIFRYALGRAATSAEHRAAENAIRGPKGISSEGLADLLWAVMMKPEFQLIY